MQESTDQAAGNVQELAIVAEPQLLHAEPEGLAQWEEGYLARLESTRLQTIVDALTRPLDARARELRARGIEAYRNAWFDDAYEDLIEAAAVNRYDFTVHQVLGNIALAHREDLEEAANHFSQAAKYAAPKSPTDAALAHVSLAAISEQQGDTEAALAHARDAVDTCSTCAEARYATAKYLAATQAPQTEVAEELLAAVKRNVQLASAAESDPSFDAYRDTVIGAIELQRGALAGAVEQRAVMLMSAAEQIEAATSTCPDPRLHGLVAETRQLHDSLVSGRDDIVALVAALARLRREGAEFLENAARVVTTVSDTVVRGQDEAHAAAKQRHEEVVELKFMFAAVGALLSGLVGAGLVFLGLLIGRTTPFMSALAIPVLGVVGAVIGVVFNGVRARAELSAVGERTDVCRSMDALASSLESLARDVAAPFRAPDGIAAGKPVDAPEPAAAVAAAG